MQFLTLNAAGKQLEPPKTLARSRRRLTQVIGRHVDRTRPHMIAVQRARDPLQPIEEAWVLRGRDKAGAVKPWPRRYLPADAVVVVVYLPRGGPMGGGSRGRKSPLNIALGIAGLALVAFAAPLAGAAAGLLGGLGAFGTAALQAGIVLGGAALLGLASKAKANKSPTDSREIYGVAGGGNLPRAGDRIPRGYGRSWMKPDLSQPDFSVYDGDDQILYKRHTLGLGKYRPYALRVGKQTVWREGQGFLPPFDDGRNALEFLYEQPSALVPNNVVSATGVGGALPRPNENPNVAGPFLINQSGALISRIQVDYQFPQGISSTYTGKQTTISNQQGQFGVEFMYRPIDEQGNFLGSWQVLTRQIAGVDGEPARFATQPLRFTRFIDVPPGRYAVTGRNVLPDTSQNNAQGQVATINAAQWDGLSGHVADNAVRPGVTEIALRIYATKGNQSAALGELEVDAAAIIPVWNGSGWIEQETSKAVWAFVDIMRNADYGGAIPASQIDLSTALFYATLLQEFDTFDAVIRGPVSVYEAAATVLLTMRAEPVHLGRFWSLVRDDQKSTRKHFISARQMRKGTTQVVFDLDTTAGAGHVIGEFDKDGDYRTPAETAEIFGEPSLTPTRQKWTGVRSYRHAKHLTRWRAACGAFRRQTAPFGVEMEGRIYKRGDSILVDPWFIETRKRAGIVDTRGDTLILDVDMPLQAGDAVALRDRTGRLWGPVALTGQGANVRQIVMDPASRAQVEQDMLRTLAGVLSDGRQEMTTVLVGPVASLRENYLIQTVRMSGPGQADVEAVIDDPRVWDAIGSVIIVPPVGAGGLLDPEVPGIVAFTATATQMAAGLQCEYTITPGRGSVAFDVQISYDDNATWSTVQGYPDGRISNSFPLNPVDPQMIALRARAYGNTGLHGNWFYTEIGLPPSVLGIEPPIVDREALADELQQTLSLDPTIPGSIGYALEQARLAAEQAFAAMDLAEGVQTAANTFQDATRGQLGSLTAASTTMQIDADLTLDALGTLIRQMDNNYADTRRDFAFARQVFGSGIDASNKAIATVATDLGSYKGNTEARFTTVFQTIADGDMALASSITNLGAQVNDPATGLPRTRADYLASVQALAEADAAEVTARQALAATVGSNTAAISSEQTTRANADSALASDITSLGVTVGNYFAGGKITFKAVAAPGGVNARYSIELVSQSPGGGTQGTGFYIDLNSDGSSAITLDTRKVRFGNGGTGVYPFQYDDATQTLTVVNLVVTGQMLVKNAATDRDVRGAENIPVPGLQTNWTEIPGTAFEFDVEAGNSNALIANVYSDFTVTANGAANVQQTALMETALAYNGNPVNGYGSNNRNVTAGGGGPNQVAARTGLITKAEVELFGGPQRVRVSVVYRLTGGASSTAFIHYAGVKYVLNKR